MSAELSLPLYYVISRSIVHSEFTRPNFTPPIFSAFVVARDASTTYVPYPRFPCNLCKYTLQNSRICCAIAERIFANVDRRGVKSNGNCSTIRVAKSPIFRRGCIFFFFFVVVLLCCPTMGWSLLSALNSCFPVSNETSGDQDTHWSCTRLSNLCFRTIDAGHLFPFFAF